MMFRGVFKRDFNKLLNELKEEYERVVDDADACRKQLTEWNKDVEIQAARQQVEKLRQHSLLQLTDIEMQRVVDFRQCHYQSCKNGSTYRYELTGTGIGTSIKIQCPKCGVEEDVTDLDSW